MPVETPSTAAGRTWLTVLLSVVLIVLLGTLAHTLIKGGERPPPLPGPVDFPRIPETVGDMRDRTRPTPGPADAGMAKRRPLPAASASAPTAMPTLEDAIPGEYVFTFYDANDRAAFEAMARRLGIRVIDSMAVGHAVRIGVHDPRLLRELLARGPTPLDAMPNIYMRIPEREDTEPLAPETGYSGFGKNALAWLGVTGNTEWGKGVTVAVLDSGIAGAGSLSDVNISHINLVGDGSDSGAHGTAVASLIAGQDESVLGVAPGVDLLSVKVISDAGAGDAFTVAKGIIESVNAGAEIICLCLGSRGSSIVLENAVAYARERGVLLVAAAGNDAVLGVSYPARYDSVVAVAAVDAKAEHLYFSNRGNELDLAAPGAAVAVSQPDGSTVLFSGTSVAVPFVVGTAAALLSEHPELKPDALAALMTRYTNDAGEPGSDDQYGAGVLDVGRLMERDTVGIYDMAILMPHATPDEAGEILHIQVSAQNRGTEPIAEVVLVIRWNGAAEESFPFYNVELGQTVSRAFSFPFHDVPNDGLVLQASVIPVGIADATPGNNGVRSLVSVTPDRNGGKGDQQTEVSRIGERNGPP